MNLLMQGVEEMRYSSQPRLSLESTFLRIIQSSDVVPVSKIIAKLDSLLKGTSPPQTASRPPAEEKKILRKAAVTAPPPEAIPKTEKTEKPPLPPRQSEPTPPLPAEQPPLPREKPKSTATQ